MAQISTIERRKLETLFEMGGGYVLDLSNRTLEEFVADSVGVEIYDDRYHHGSGSKANRIRGFWKVEPDAVAGKLISDLIDYAEFVRKDLDPALVAVCRATAARLLRARASVPLQTPATPPVVSSGPPSGQPIRVFISYSWDSDAHKDWVREFADGLASNGIDIILDQYDLQIGDDRFYFMERSVREADAVLCICTPAYVSKANGRTSGVGVETSLITPQFFERIGSTKQFIPIIRESKPDFPTTPDYLSGLIFGDFRDSSNSKAQMEQLLRHLHREPRLRKPVIGSKPRFE
jgi:hypothetical protein